MSLPEERFLSFRVEELLQEALAALHQARVRAAASTMPSIVPRIVNAIKALDEVVDYAREVRTKNAK